MRAFTGFATLLAFMAKAAYGQWAVVGVVTHEATGEPYPGVFVGGVGYGRQLTDADGAFRIDDAPVGMWIVEFRCAIRGGVNVGREINTQPVTVRAHELPSTVNMAVPEGYCDEPPYTERTVEVRGYLSLGFERNQFKPCDPESLNLSKNTFFDEPNISAGFPTLPIEFKDDTLYFVDLVGTLRGPGIPGFLTVDYVLWFDNVLRSYEVADENCARDIRRARRDGRGHELTAPR